MFAPSAEFLHPKLFKFQIYLDNVYILEPLQHPLVAVVDMSHQIFIYNLNAPDDKTLMKGITFKHEKKKHGILQQPHFVEYLKHIEAETIALKYENSDIMVLDCHYKSTTMHLKHSKHASHLLVFDNKTLIFFVEDPASSYHLYLERWPKQRRKTLNFSSKSLMRQTCKLDSQSIIILQEKALVTIFNVILDQTVRELKTGFANPARTVRFTDHEVLVAERDTLSIYDIKSSKVCSLQIPRAPLTEIEGRCNNNSNALVSVDKLNENTVLMALEEALEFYSLDADGSLRLLKSMRISDHLPKQRYKTYKLGDITTTSKSEVVMVVQVSTEDEDLPVKLEDQLWYISASTTVLSCDAPVKFVDLEKNARQRVLFISKWQNEFISLVTDSNEIIHYDLRANKIKVRKILDLPGCLINYMKILDPTRLFITYQKEDNALEHFFDVISWKSLAVRNRNATYAKQGIKFISPIRLLSDGSFVTNAMKPKVSKKKNLGGSGKKIKAKISTKSIGFDKSNVESTKSPSIDMLNSAQESTSSRILDSAEKRVFPWPVPPFHDGNLHAKEVLNGAEKQVTPFSDGKPGVRESLSSTEKPIFPSNRHEGKPGIREFSSSSTKAVTESSQALGEQKMFSERNAPSGTETFTEKYRLFNSSASIISAHEEEDANDSDQELIDDLNLSKDKEAIQMVEEKKLQASSSTFNKEAALIEITNHLIRIRFIGRASMVTILETTELPVIDIVELDGAAGFLAMRESLNRKMVRTVNLKGKCIDKEITFTGNVEEIARIDEKKGAAVVKPSEGKNEMIIIFDWRENLALMVIECKNVKNLLGVISNHLMWADSNEDYEDNVYYLNLKNCKYPQESEDVSDELDCSVCSGDIAFRNTKISKGDLVSCEVDKRKKIVFFDELHVQDSIVMLDVKRIDFELLKLVYRSLVTKFGKKVVEDVCKLLLPRYKEQDA